MEEANTKQNNPATFKGVSYEDLMSYLVGCIIMLPEDMSFFTGMESMKTDEMQRLRDIVMTYMFNREMSFLTAETESIQKDKKSLESKEVKETYDEYVKRLEELRKIERKITVNTTV